jgi:hypothetical protein
VCDELKHEINHCEIPDGYVILDGELVTQEYADMTDIQRSFYKIQQQEKLEQEQAERLEQERLFALAYTEVRDDIGDEFDDMLAVGELAEAIEEKFYEIYRREYEQKRRETDEWWENEIAEFSERMREAGYKFSSRRGDGGKWADGWGKVGDNNRFHLGGIAGWDGDALQRAIQVGGHGEVIFVPIEYVLCVETKSWVASCDCEKNIPPFPVDLLIDILKN